MACYFYYQVFDVVVKLTAFHHQLDMMIQKPFVVFDLFYS